ncbi:hypothetical protein BLNAU_11246 [Blattamonas nauphoetae]|uniref:Uncharacterized protein n=1 Tax=Blattamonas nauphoetae TaxID=2049346 RepID=A0ABQ9XN75_9EUKA|nr:hypothetical protein BLNAU_11246 [Blattamonas nauphoetae]
MDGAVHKSGCLTPTQRETFINLSAEFIFAPFQGRHLPTTGQHEAWTNDLIRVFKVGRYPVFTEGLGKLGFFARVVNGVTDSSHDYFSMQVFQYCATCWEWRKNHGRKSFEEEGWEDAMEFILIRKEKSSDYYKRDAYADSMTWVKGANLRELFCWERI